MFLVEKKLVAQTLEIFSVALLLFIRYKQPCLPLTERIKTSNMVLRQFCQKKVQLRFHCIRKYVSYKSVLFSVIFPSCLRPHCSPFTVSPPIKLHAHYWAAKIKTKSTNNLFIEKCYFRIAKIDNQFRLNLLKSFKLQVEWILECKQCLNNLANAEINWNLPWTTSPAFLKSYLGFI